MADKGTLAKAGIKKGDSKSAIKQKFSAYSAKEAQKEKAASGGMTAEQKIAKRRAEQQANPERFQSVIKNKNKVTKKLVNMGQDYKPVNKIVTADRERRRAENPNADSFVRGQRAGRSRVLAATQAKEAAS